MADEHAPGWWQASDGRWYPPELHPDATAVAPPPTSPPLASPPALDASVSLDKPASPPGGFAPPGTTDLPTPPPGGAALPGFDGPGYGGAGATGAGYAGTGYGAPGYGAAPYGAPAPYGGYGAPFPTGPKTAGLAVAAIILGIGSFVVSLIPFLGFFSVPFALAGIGTGIGALSQTKKTGEKGRGFGITGIVTGVLALGVSVLWVLVFNAASNEIDNYDWQDFEDINSDPSDGYCDMDRYLQDPDC